MISYIQLTIKVCNKIVALRLFLNISVICFGNVFSGHLLASAATNGAVVLWNLNKPSRSKQGQ